MLIIPLTVVVMTLANDLVPNGGFEEGNTGFDSDYVFAEVSCTVATTYKIVASPNDCHDSWADYEDHTPDGNLMMIVNGSTEPGLAVWETTVEVAPSTTYVFSVWASSAFADSPASLRLVVNGEVIGDAETLPSTAGTWIRISRPWCSFASESATLAIIDENLASGGNDFALDDVALAPVEPGSGDLDGNGLVNGVDLGLLLSTWGACPAEPSCCPADLNGDFIVDGVDLGILLGDWGVP